MDFEFPDSAPLKPELSCQIISTAAYLPEKRVTNDEIIEKMNLSISDKAVRSTIGTVERRIVEEGVCDTDLMVEAARKCLDQAGVKPENLTKLIVNKFLGDRVLPMTASFLQSRLGCTKAIHSFDIDGGINSFLQSFDMAQKLIGTGDEYILIVSGGIISALVEKDDPRALLTYGDGAAAVLIGPADSSEFEASYFFSNCEFADLYTGFSRTTKYRGYDFFETHSFENVCEMYETGNWLEAREFILTAMDHTCAELLSQADLTLEDIDLFLITENNIRMRNDIIEKIGIPEDKCHSVIEKYGNTLSAMIPIMINDVRETGRFKEGDRVMILSVGEGINGGGIIYKQ